LGDPPTSKALAAWLNAAEVPYLIADPTGAWPDPERGVAVNVRMRPGGLCRALAAPVPFADAAGAADPEWAASWGRAESQAQATFDKLLADHTELTEPAIARTVTGAGWGSLF